MRSTPLHHLMAALLFQLGLQAVSSAQNAPPVINYQGRLTQSTGVVVPDGLTGIRVRIFAAASGGTSLWDSGDLSVATKSGTFSILLGSGVMPPMSPIVFALGTAYIEVQPSGQMPLLPRQPIASVPWAIYAQTVSNDAISSSKMAPDWGVFSKISSGNVLLEGGADPYLYAARLWSRTLRLDSPTSSELSFFSSSTLSGRILGLAGGRLDFQSGLTNFTGYLGVNTASAPSHALDVNGNGYFSGNVGIGQPDPQTKLDVIGSVRVQSANGAVTGIESLGMQGGVHGSGPTYGVVGDGGQYGVKGSSAQGNYGAGVYGEATSETGNARGGHFTSNSPGGQALYAINSKPGGTGLFVEAPSGTAGYFNGEVYITNGILKVNGEAQKPGGGSWSVLSDGRLKKNIGAIEGPLDQFLKLRGHSFEYKHPQEIHERSGTTYGFIAQEMEGVFPNWVNTRPDGLKSISLPVAFDALAVEAIREQQKKISSLQEEIKRLNAYIASRDAAIEERLRSLEGRKRR